MKIIINKKLAQNIWDKDLDNIKDLTPVGPDDPVNPQHPINIIKPEVDDEDTATIDDNEILQNYLEDKQETKKEESIQDPYLLGVPQETEEIQYSNIRQMLFDAMDNKEVVSFSYITRKGRSVGTRIVEPHYTFIANTGNEILVSFDRSVNGIRAFIVGNIGANGVRYKNVHFAVRPAIMR